MREPPLIGDYKVGSDSEKEDIKEDSKTDSDKEKESI
ncbi:hypothetical protein K3495_g12925 [Podosphaera aphanis]|nr:hypothetical protein K3495_g12925 [Podosphaera aphanis]